MPFRFRLERVLSWRRAALAREQARLENLRAGLRAVETSRQELITKRLRLQLETAAASFITGQDLAGIEMFRQWAAREEIGLAARAASLHADMASQSAAVLAADRDVRLVERLRERRHDAWSAEDQRLLDDMAGETGAAAWRRKSATNVR